MRPTRSGARASAWAWAWVAVAGCATDVPLTAVLVDAARCGEFCATELRVEAGGAVSTHACGAAIELPAISPGEVAEVRVTTMGPGIPLSGRVELTPQNGETTRVSLVLTPTAQPTIDAVNALGGAALLGDALLELTGAGFGAPGPSSSVEVGGAAAEVLVWSDDRIVVRTARAGAAVVVRCGVASAAVESRLREPRVEVLRPIPVAAGCADGRMVAVSSLEGGMNDDPLALFDCGTEAACGRALFGRLPGESDELLNYWGPFGMCPLAGSQYDDRRVFFGNGAGPSRCQLLVGPDQLHMLSCVRLSTATPDVRAVGAISEDLAYFIVGTERTLGMFSGGAVRRILADEIPRALGLDGRYVLGRQAGQVLVHELDEGAIVRSTPVAGCGTPRRFIANDGRRPDARAVVVVCDTDDRLFLHRFDFSRSRDELLPPLELTSISPDRVALTVDGTRAIVWDHMGTIAAYDLERRIPLARITVDPTYARAELVRSPASDIFYFGGPRPGDVMRLDLR